MLCQYLRARLRDMAQDFVYLQHIGRMTVAVAALENNSYDPASITSIADLAERYDPLGQLARLFNTWQKRSRPADEFAPNRCRR